jgi:hypothetical protein
MHRRFQKVYGGFTRPADTTNYGALDAMGQGAGDCIISFPISPAGADLSGRVSGKVVSAHLTKSDTGVTNDTFRLHLWAGVPSVDPDENAAVATSWFKEADQKLWIGQMDFETAEVGADAVLYQAQDFLPAADGLHFEINKKSEGPAIYGLLAAIGTYNPASAEVFNIMLNIE